MTTKQKTSTRRTVTVKDVPAHEFVLTYAKHLKRTNAIKLPKWADLVKGGIHKQLAPSNPDWYYIRAASIARKVYLRCGLGVGKMTKIYGGLKHRGPRPSRFKLGSSSIARDIMKQLERIGVIEKDPKGGRRITQQGQRDLDRIARRVAENTTNAFTLMLPSGVPTPAPKAEAI
jgi:small subunit ribosomal protein S19e